MHTLAVRDVMSSPVITIQAHTRLPIIKALMWQWGMHRLPVVEGRRVLGIITLGDVRSAFPSDILAINIHRQMLPLERLRALDMMRTDVVTITQDASIPEAAQVMLRHTISGLPVLDGDRLVGMITKSDVCRAAAGGTITLAQPVARQIPSPQRDVFHYQPPATNSSVPTAPRWQVQPYGGWDGEINH
jgi:acetoin utilization protein AcuB